MVELDRRLGFIDLDTPTDFVANASGGRGGVPPVRDDPDVLLESSTYDELALCRDHRRAAARHPLMSTAGARPAR